MSYSFGLPTGLGTRITQRSVRAGKPREADEDAEKWRLEAVGFGLRFDAAEARLSLDWALDGSAAKQETHGLRVFLASVALTSLKLGVTQKGTADSLLAFWLFPDKPLLL